VAQSLKIKRLREDVPAPDFAHPGDAGLDLRAADGCTIAPFERILIPTGISLAIPEGHAGLILPRSGNALKQGLSLANTPGLIDSGYRGEIKVLAINLDPRIPITIEPGDRIAQLVIIATAQLALIEADELDTTIRGAGGFGSTGTGSQIDQKGRAEGQVLQDQ